MNNVWTSTAHVRTDVLLVAGLILAVVATVHILLRKAEVQSAVGWIDHPPLRWTRVTAYAAAASRSLLIGVM
jgi:hypothetical protein